MLQNFLHFIQLLTSHISMYFTLSFNGLCPNYLILEWAWGIRELPIPYRFIVEEWYRHAMHACPRVTLASLIHVPRRMVPLLLSAGVHGVWLYFAVPDQFYFLGILSCFGGLRGSCVFESLGSGCELFWGSTEIVVPYLFGGLDAVQHMFFKVLKVMFGALIVFFVSFLRSWSLSGTLWLPSRSHDQF